MSGYYNFNVAKMSGYYNDLYFNDLWDTSGKWGKLIACAIKHSHWCEELFVFLTLEGHDIDGT